MSFFLRKKTGMEFLSIPESVHPKELLNTRLKNGMMLLLSILVNNILEQLSVKNMVSVKILYRTGYGNIRLMVLMA